MALVNCKECGKVISKKAKSCPSCGAPNKRTSSLSRFILLFIVFAFLITLFRQEDPVPEEPKPLANSENVDVSVNNTPTNEPSNAEHETNSAQEQEQSTSIEPLPQSNFRLSSDEDAITGEFTFYAISNSHRSISRMQWPYHNTESWIGYGCGKDAEWLFLGFSDAPNLTNTDVRDGYHLFDTRVRIDNNVETAWFTQDWGSAFLGFKDDAPWIEKIMRGSTFRVELKWHGTQGVYFEYDLTGSASSIRQARSNCNAL